MGSAGVRDHQERATAGTLAATAATAAAAAAAEAGAAAAAASGAGAAGYLNKAEHFLGDLKEPQIAM